jgi:hypothetical protein
MISKYWIEKDRKESGRSLIYGSVAATTRVTEENHQILVTPADVQLQILTGIFRAIKKKIGDAVNKSTAIRNAVPTLETTKQLYCVRKWLLLIAENLWNTQIRTLGKKLGPSKR